MNKYKIIEKHVILYECSSQFEAERALQRFLYLGHDAYMVY